MYNNETLKHTAQYIFYHFEKIFKRSYQSQLKTTRYWKRNKIKNWNFNPTRGSLWNASRVPGVAFKAPPPYKNQFRRGHFDPIF